MVEGHLLLIHAARLPLRSTRKRRHDIYICILYMYIYAIYNGAWFKHRKGETGTVLPRTNAVVLLVLVTNAGKTESFFNTCELNWISFVDCDLVCSNWVLSQQHNARGYRCDTARNFLQRRWYHLYAESKWNWLKFTSQHMYLHSCMEWTLLVTVWVWWNGHRWDHRPMLPNNEAFDGTWLVWWWCCLARREYIYTLGIYRSFHGIDDDHEDLEAALRVIEGRCCWWQDSPHEVGCCESAMVLL
jgi:hypothetical protein